jgi:hypothetical protein
MLLIGGIVAFFVEPILERVRNILEWSKGDRSVDRRQRALLKALVSVVFALTSVSIHDSMIEFVSHNDLDSAADGSALNAAVALVVEWAIVPFAIALAWQSVESRWLAMPIGVVAAFSSALSGWLFAWSMRTVIATAIPCLIIQYFGYRQIKSRPEQQVFVPHAAVVAGSAVAWLVAAALLDASFSVFDLHSMRLYNASRLSIDLRFYFGWTVGVLLASSARIERDETRR